jgi:hypothetical protein
VKVGPDMLFHNKSPLVKQIYDRLAGEMEKFGNVKVSSTKSSVMFVSRSTFLAVKPKKNWLDIEFVLEDVVNEYPIYKTFRANKSRVAHFVRLESLKDVNKQLIRLLKLSYTITGGVKSAGSQ